MAGQFKGTYITFTPQHRSSSSYAKKHTVPINVNDPKLQSLTANFKLARLNADASFIALEKTLSNYLTTLQGVSSSSGPGTSNGEFSSPSGTPTPTPGRLTAQVTNLSAAWSTDGLASIILTFTFDFRDPANSLFDHIAVELHNSAGSNYVYITPFQPYNASKLNTSSTSQTLTITQADWSTTGIFYPYLFDGVGIATYDTAGQTSDYVTASLATYQSLLSAPIITSAHSKSAYTITTTNIDTVKSTYPLLFQGEVIQEYITTTVATGTDAQIKATIDAEAAAATVGWTTVGEPRTVSPTTVFANDGLHRYVRAYFIDKANSRSAYSNYVEAKPDELTPNNTVPPSGVTNASGAFNGTNHDGNDVIIGYTLPSIDNTDINRVVSLKVKLIPTASTGLTGYFYHTVTPPVTGSTTSTDTFFTIPSSQLFAQFGSYYDSFSGTIVAVSQSGTESSSTANITTFSRTNSLTTVSPTGTLTNVIDGYSIQLTLGSSSATYAQVYQFWIIPSAFSDNNVAMADYMDVSGIVSYTANTITVSSLTLEGGNFTIPTGYTISNYAGYGITGTNLADNTYVQSITTSGSNYVLTLNQNMTGAAAGSYHMQALVYSGIGPANIFENYFSNLYPIITFYDQYGNRSKNSAYFTALPIDPASVNASAPVKPTVAFVSSTYNTITVSISTTDSTVKGYRLKYKKSTDTLYTTDIVAPISAFSAGTSTTSYTINNLTPNATYNIFATAYNQYNNIGPISDALATNPTTPAATVATPGTISLTAQAYQVTASWIAASNTPTQIANYKIELYDSSNTLKQTQYTYSTTNIFQGLSASTTYYVKVYSIDIYNEVSSATTSSNIALNANGVWTGGSVPSSSPTPIVNPLYQALEVKWTGIADPSIVTYEVHLSSSTGFTPSSATKALETESTYAIIKTLPGTSTGLTYGTAYYIKLIAKNLYGATSAGTQASGTPLAVDNGDIAANAIRANVIKAGTITATQVDTNNLLVNNLFTVGGSQAIVTGASVSGSNITYTTQAAHSFAVNSLVNVTGMTTAAFNVTGYQITGITTTSPYTFTVGVGSSGATGSVSGQAAAVATGLGSSAIKIDGTGDGLTTPIKIYSGVGTYNTTTTPFYLDSIGRFSLKDRVTFDGNNTLTVNGVINAQSGNFAGAMTVNNGTMKIGTNADGGTNSGIYINANNYWYSSGNIKIGGSSNNVTWDGTSLTVTGNINAQGGSFAGNVQISNGSVYGGTTLSPTISAYVGSAGQATFTTSSSHGLSTGVTIYVSGLTGTNSASFNGTFVTITGTTGSTIVASPIAGSSYTIPTQTSVTGQTGTIQNLSAGFVLNSKLLSFNNSTTIDGSNGKLYTKSANIGGWTVDSSKLEYLSGSNYSGFSTTGTYSIYAGSKVSGGDISNFAVTPSGTVYARNLRLSGGSIDIGGTSVNTTLNTSVTTGATSLIVTNGGSITANMYVIGEGIAFGTTVTSVATNTIGLSAGTTSAIAAGTSLNFVSSDGAHISSTGVLTAAGVNISGSLNVKQASTFSSNITLDANAYLVAGSQTGTGMVISASGLTAKDASGTPVITTQILASPAGTTADGAGITFATTAAQLGSGTNPWIVQSGKIYSGSSSGIIELDSVNRWITIFASDSTSYGVRMQGGSQSTGGYALVVGSLSNPNFKVSYSGTMTATSAIITGTISASVIKSGKTSAADTTNSGYYLDSAGNFIMGGTTSNAYIQWNGSVVGIYGKTYTDAIDQKALTPKVTIDGTNGLILSSVQALGNLDSANPSGITSGNAVNMSNGFVRMIIASPEDLSLKRGPAIYYNTSDPVNAGFVGDIWFTHA